MAVRPRGSPAARILSGLANRDGSGDSIGGLGCAVLGLLAVASAILELTMALGCCYGAIVAMGLEKITGAATVFGLRKKGVVVGLVSYVSGRR